MAYIELEDMEFHSFHGCFKEERIVGNKFLVQLAFEMDSKKAELSDNIIDTVNYQSVYTLVKEEMIKPSHLLEHIARRILNRIKAEFPEILAAKVKVSKMNPPMGGKMRNVSVTLNS